MFFWERIKTVGTLYEALSKPVLKKYDLTQMEYDILMFLHNNPQYKTAADIVKIRMLTKSHVSSSLKSLEQRGYIIKGYGSGNRKSILLELTPASSDIIKEGMRIQDTFSDILNGGISDGDMNQFRETFIKIFDKRNSKNYYF